MTDKSSNNSNTGKNDSQAKDAAANSATVVASAKGTDNSTVIKPGTSNTDSPKNSTPQKPASKTYASDKSTVIASKPSPKQTPEQTPNHSIKQPISHKEQKAKPEIKSATPTPALPAAENVLTQIFQSAHDDNSTHGFDKAKAMANKALAEDKIILNKRFVLEEMLGCGGMGAVYRAKDLRKVEADDLNPFVAVKVLNDEFKNHPQAFVTLQREASRSHILSHPNIVTVHDFDRDGDVIYMTMELLQGQDLDSLLYANKGKGLPFDEALSIFKEMCKALIFAHKKEIIHSDLKPGNIFITSNGAKILDFGIARLVNDSQGDFDAGSLGALTPSYASLEMINESAPPAASDDIYAAAIIFYELLTGKHPYQHKPADEALKQNLKPAKIESLKKNQWLALEKALQLDRSKRTSSLEELLQEFTGEKKFPLFKVVSLVLLAATATLAYFVLSEGDLDSHAQEAFLKGEECFEAKDWSCALKSYNTALKLRPRHSQAKEKLKLAQEKQLAETLNTLKSEANECLESSEDLICAKSKLSELTRLAPNSDVAKQVNEMIATFEKNQKIKAAMIQANQCLQQVDFECSLEQIEQVLSLAPNHKSAISFKDKIIAEQQKTSAKLQELEQKYKKAITAGQKCHTNQNYDCAVEHFKKAIEAKPADIEAQTLHKNAIFAKKQQKESLDKAATLVSKGSSCFNKNNFSCAITNAKLALDLVKGYKPAKSLLWKADKARKEHNAHQAIIDNQFQSMFDQAIDCYELKQFDCAVTYIKQANKLRPNDPEARAFLQKTIDSQNNMEKATRLLDKASTCLNRKNYTCAISNAESALEFVPDYAPAVEMHEKASSELRKVKRSIKIE